MIRRIRPTLGLLWRSLSFRLTLNYGLLAVFTTLVLLAFIYLQVIGAQQLHFFRQAGSNLQRLMVDFQEGGRADLVKALTRTLSGRGNSGQEIFLLLDENGRKLVGNFDSLSTPIRSLTDTSQVRIMREGKPTVGRLRIQRLSDGATLVVGHDLSELNDIESRIGQAGLAAVLIALLLIALGTYIFRQELERRMGAIRRTAAKISAGQLRQRIPLSPGEDEFSYLNRDINAMLDQIETLMKGVRHVSDTIAHNLRTPLMRIVSRLRKAQQPERSLSEVLEATQFAVQEIETLTALFGKLLQIAEIEAGVQRQSFVQCQLDAVASDVVELYDAVAEDRHLSLAFQSEGTVLVNGDRDLLSSALANLVDNALKYSRENVRVRVRTETSGTARVIVEDDGPGIPAAEYSRLGTHFHRVDPGLEGHGLGLTSVLAIVRLHGGQLHFEDASPGLRVTVDLPADAGADVVFD